MPRPVADVIRAAHHRSEQLRVIAQEPAYANGTELMDAQLLDELVAAMQPPETLVDEYGDTGIVQPKT